MQNFPQKAADLFKNGDSCSEAIVRAAFEHNLIDSSVDIELLNSIASSFSGGIGGSGCLCGAVAGAEMIIGIVFGRKNSSISSRNIRFLSKQFVQKFKEKRKATCCKVLSLKFKSDPVGRTQNCTDIVYECAEILENIINEHLKEKKQEVLTR